MRNKTMRHLVLINLFLVFSFLSLCLGDRAHAGPAAPTDYSLVGTIQSRNFSGATIIIDKEQVFFRLFDKLPDGSRLVQVRDDSISLKGEDGTKYDMYIAHGQSAAASAAETQRAALVAREPTPKQLERIEKNKQRMQERARRAKSDVE